MINWRGGCFLDLKALLNKEQYEGAVTVNGPVLILAGAGSGKTEVLSERVIYNLKNNYMPISLFLHSSKTNSPVQVSVSIISSLLRAPRFTPSIKSFVFFDL